MSRNLGGMNMDFEQLVAVYPVGVHFTLCFVRFLIWKGTR